MSCAVTIAFRVSPSFLATTLPTITPLAPAFPENAKERSRIGGSTVWKLVDVLSRFAEATDSAR